jgi:hypothetical protein
MFNVKNIMSEFRSSDTKEKTVHFQIVWVVPPENDCDTVTVNNFQAVQ